MWEEIEARQVAESVAAELRGRGYRVRPEDIDSIERQIAEQAAALATKRHCMNAFRTTASLTVAAPLEDLRSRLGSIGRSVVQGRPRG